MTALRAADHAARAIEEKQARRAARWPSWVRLADAVLRDHGHVVAPPARVLDLGCGRGDLVRAYRDAGYDAFGCDIVVDGPHDDRIRAVALEPYRLPFDSEWFDLVVSDQVLEHVRDHDTVLAEIRRVLRPGGVSLHVFPSRWRPIEPHVFVPLATVLRARWWLALWARLGVRNDYQAGMAWREVTGVNHDYLHAQTNYLSRGSLRRAAARHFGNVAFAERSYLVHHPGRWAAARRVLADRLPGASPLFASLHSRCLIMVRP